MGFFDLFRPTWKHSNPDTRLEAVRQITDSALLQKIVHTDEDVRIRRVAIKKIEDISALEKISQKDADLGLRHLAQERATALSIERILGASTPQDALQALLPQLSSTVLLTIAQKSPWLEVQTAALQQLQSDKELVLAVQQLQSLPLRKQTLHRIQNLSSLRELGLSLQHRELAEMLVEKLNDHKILEELAERGTKAVRQAVQAKRNQGESKKAFLPLSPEKARDKRQKLCRLAESISLSSDWDDATDRLEEVQKEWQTLLPSSENSEDQALQTRFTQALEQFRLRKQAALVRLREEARTKEVQAQRRQANNHKKQASLRTASPKSTIPEELVAPEESQPSIEKKDLRVAYKEHQNQLQHIAQELLTELEKTTRKQVEQRLQTWQEALQNLEALPSAWQRPVREQLRNAREALRKRLQEIKEAQDWKMWSTQSSLEQLCVRVEALQQETDMAVIVQQFSDIALQWRNLRPIRMEKVDVLKERFRRAFEPLAERVTEYKKQQRQQQMDTVPKKEALCQEAEILANSTDWNETDVKLRALQAQWKELGPLPREHARILQERFRNACNQFYKRRKEYLRQQQGLYQQRIQQKEALCIKAEAAAESSDWRKTNALLRSLMNDWKGVEPIPRALNQALWERFRRAFDLFYQRREAYFERQKEEAEQNLKQKQAICEQLGTLLDTTPMIANAAYEKLQSWRSEWRDIGPVPKESTQALEQRFLQLCEQFLQRFRSQLSATQRQELTKALSRFENRIVLPGSLSSRQASEEINAKADLSLELSST